MLLTALFVLALGMTAESIHSRQENNSHDLNRSNEESYKDNTDVSHIEEEQSVMGNTSYGESFSHSSYDDIYYDSYDQSDDWSLRDIAEYYGYSGDDPEYGYRQFLDDL